MEKHQELKDTKDGKGRKNDPLGEKNQDKRVAQTTNKPRQGLGSKQPFDPNCLSIVLSCSQGISGVQVPRSFCLTTSNAPVRNGHNGAKQLLPRSAVVCNCRLK
jgi:hypothetical protein